jgi:1,2-diacylglycerol 3-beta-galactosyltransferase
MDMEYPGRFDVELLDPFVDGSRPFLRWLVYRYNWLIKHMPRTYGLIFHGTDNRAMTRAAIKLFGNQFRPGIRRKLSDARPAGVVSFHPLTNHLVVEAIEKLALDVPFITVITDMSDFHRFWMSKKAQVVVVPSAEARRYCVRKGLDARKVHVAGLPVDPRFTGPVHGEQKRQVRERLGLADRPTLLLVAGGEGAGRLGAQTKAVDDAGLGLQLLVVCGRNERMRAKLAERAYQGDVSIYGFVDNMPELMQASDAIATKAGPGTIAEALISGLPIFLTYYVPGQEEGNVHFVLEQGVGYYTRRISKLLQVLRRCFVEDRAEFERMQGRAEKVGRPGAAAEIADLIAAAVEPPLAVDEELL